MKKILFFGVILLLTACSKSELEQLKSDQEDLKKQADELTKQPDPLSEECQKLVAQYKDALAKNSSDMEAKKEAGKKVCQQAFDLSNQVLELRDEIFNIQIAILQKKTKEKLQNELYKRK